MRALTILIFFLLSTVEVHAQKEANIWYFGDHAGIDFNKGTPPTILTDGQLSTAEGCATMCNRIGKLLFYTDGVVVYDRAHHLMPNGNGLLGHNSSTQSAITVPFPEDSMRYYIFTVDQAGSENGLRYSVVNMRLNNGFGDIEKNAKNILLLTPICEKIAVMRISGKMDYWVVTQVVSGDTFYAWKITPNGISTNPIISKAGKHTIFSSVAGYLKFNRQGTRLASCYSWGISFDILNFDERTGIVSNTISIDLSYPYFYPYGCEFSADGHYLYIGTLVKPNVFQYDLAKKTAVDIKASEFLLATELTTPGALQMGPDGIIYVCVGGNYLSAITNPNGKHNNAGYIKNFIGLKNCALGLPTIITTLFDCPQVNLGKDTLLCIEQQLILKNYIPGASYLWQDGSTADTLVVNKSGKYSVACTYKDCISYDTINVTFQHLENPFSSKDTILCQGAVFTIRIPDSIPNITWSNGSHSHTFSTSMSEKIWVNTRVGGCERTDTLNIRFVPPVKFSIHDTIICRGESYKINLPFPYPVKWQDGATSHSYTINSSGNYRLLVYDLCGVKQYSFKVSYHSEEPISLPLDTFFCRGSSVRIIAGSDDSFFNYLWSNGTTLNYLNIADSGTYTVIKTSPCKSWTAQIKVRKEICECPAFYPNAFTPNGDSINESWKPIVCPVSNWSLQIYNRWGELMWESFDQNQSWDGKFRGRVSPEGLFVFRLSYLTSLGEMIYHRGSFYLTR